MGFGAECADPVSERRAVHFVSYIHRLGFSSILDALGSGTRYRPKYPLFLRIMHQSILPRILRNGNGPQKSGVTFYLVHF